MTWQDELRRLDEELAAGRISAAEYRARRDQVVSAAANPGAPPQAPNQPPAQATQIVPPVGQPQTPHQPPQPPQPQPPQPIPPPPQQSSEATQVVPGRPQPNEPERTQMVNPNAWQGNQRGGPPGGSPSDAERTQVVPGVTGPGYPPPGGRPPGMPSPPGGFPQQQPPQQGWPDEDELAPPWGGSSDFPPLVPQASDAWLKQGPEVFEDGKGRTGRIVLIVVAVVVLAGLGIGAYLLWGRSTPNGQKPPPVAEQTTTTTTSRPPSPVEIGKIPGQSTGKTVKDFQDVIALNYLAPPEISAYQAASPGRSALVVNTLDGGTAIVLNVQADSVSAAQTAANALYQAQLANHAQPVSGQPVGVQVSQAGNTIRGHYYTTKGVIVRVEVTGTSPDAALTDFTKVLAAQLKALPANE